MAQIKANGITLEYEDFGPKNGPVILLIMGLGAQLTRWPEAFIANLTERGYRVIRYDNRDVGLSQKFDSAGVPQMAQLVTDMMQRKPIATAYSLKDMADDAAGLLGALGIAKAHIVGASMGGMIGQLVAALHPDKTISLTSIMSSTGNPELPTAKPEAMAVLTTRPPSDDLQAMIDAGVKAARVIGSPRYPAEEKTLRENIARDIARSNYPPGFVRQMAAAMANGDRRPHLKNITAPTLVIHGADDPLVPVEAGRDTAANIRGAGLLEIPGMGHDLPVELYGQIAGAIDGLASRAHH